MRRGRGSLPGRCCRQVAPRMQGWEWAPSCTFVPLSGPTGACQRGSCGFPNPQPRNPFPPAHHPGPGPPLAAWKQSPEGPRGRFTVHWPSLSHGDTFPSSEQVISRNAAVTGRKVAPLTVPPQWPSGDTPQALWGLPEAPWACGEKQAQRGRQGALQLSPNPLSIHTPCPAATRWPVTAPTCYFCCDLTNPSL